ncbi:MAG: NAD-dependent epimerase/dehydratase family protein, partial [Spirochaetota bacterium]
MKIKNIAVTGASGKIGRHVIPELLKAGYRVRALEHETPVNIKGVEIMKGDLSDESFPARFIEDMDAVIHLANVKENRDKFMSVNVLGTFCMLDACWKSGHIQQFIQAGSDARAGIFYYSHPFPIDETYPHSAYPGYYAFSKVIEETMCEQYIIQYNLPITTLRFSWVYAEDDVLAHATLKEPNFGVPVWKELAVRPGQKEFFEKGLDAAAKLVHPDGRPGIRHVVSIKDVVQSVLLAVGNKSVLYQAFNIVGPSPFSYDILANYISEKLNIPVVEFEYDIFHDFQIDLNKSHSVLGYNPQYNIIDMVDM